MEDCKVANSSSRSSDVGASNASNGPPAKRRRNLPNIGLPTFSGDSSTWKGFHDLFLSMIGNNEDIPDVEKMHYLKTSLSGDAAKLVANIKISNDAFARAWKVLVARYDNKRDLVSTQLDNLFKLKPIRAKSARDLNSMIASVTDSADAIQALGYSTESWYPFLVHLMARLLDDETHEAWQVKLGTTTSYPTLNDFEDFVVGHTRAWESRAARAVGFLKEKKRAVGTSTSDTRARSLFAATSTGGGSAECQLCKSDHYLSSCPTYLSLPCEKRKRTIIKFNLCFNCLKNHAVKNCKSPRRCRKCAQKHHTTIHDANKQYSKPSVQIESKPKSNESATSPPPPSGSS